MSDGSSAVAQAEAEATVKITATGVTLSAEPATAQSDHRSRAKIQMVPLDSRDFRVLWPMAIATLEQISGWPVLALRLGTLALIQQCVRELAVPNARADLIVRLRTLTDALAHMPLET